MDRRLVPIVILLLVSGTALSLAAYLFGIFSFDQEVALRLREFNHPLLIAVMQLVSYPGDGWGPVVLTLAVAAICATKKRWPEAFIVVATLSAIFIAGVLKLLVGRPRPPASVLDLNEMVLPVNQYAYPSGHVLFYVVFFGFVAYLAWHCFTGSARKILIVFCTAFIVFIGPSRIFLEDHWVSDVIGSYLIGSFLLIILILAYRLVRSPGNREDG